MSNILHRSNWFNDIITGNERIDYLEGCLYIIYNHGNLFNVKANRLLFEPRSPRFQEISQFLFLYNY